MDSKISQFVSQTGADAAVAKDLLQGITTFYSANSSGFSYFNKE